MMSPHPRRPLRWSVVPALAAALLVSACGSRQEPVDIGAVGADQFLYERGVEAMEARDWDDAREFFTRLIDGFPASQYRAEAKLNIGEIYLEQGSAETLVLAQAEFRDFLAYYPTSPRADYAQYSLAMTHFNTMRSPGRDQTETEAAIRELTIFVERFPDSDLIEEARTRLREARDRLSESEFRVGLHYHRVRWYPGAIARFRELLENDPEYTRRDEVYFYLAESYRRADNRDQAVAYYERLLTEFDSSEYLEDARQWLGELKPGVDAQR